jgi:transposase
MIQITAQMRVLVAIESVDGRKGIDSLVRLCREKLDEDPFSGCVARVPEPQGDFDSVTQL